MAQNNPYSVPTGVYFKPSDSEIVLCLQSKNSEVPLRADLIEENSGVPLRADLIEEFDIYTCSPEELIGKFPYGKENELYFFVPRNSEKSRMSRIVKQDYGFWSSTGNIIIKYIDGVILQKGTLDFYVKSAEGNDKKTDWKMNEYSLASESSSMYQTSSSRGAKRKKEGRFVLCKIYGHKTQVVENPMRGMQVGDGDGSNNPDSGPSSWDIKVLKQWLASTQA